MKSSVRPTARRALAAALAALLLLSAVTAVGYTSIITALAAEESVESYAPAGTTLVSKGASVSISACTNQRAGSENSYEMPSERWAKALLVDGKIGNGGWSCQPYDREPDHTKPVTVTLKLTAEAEVSAVTLFPNGQFPAKYEIQVSTDGKTYHKVAEDAGVAIKQSAPKTYRFTATAAKYVRLHIIERNPAQSADGALAQLGELAVFGTAAAAMTLERAALELYVGETDTLTPVFYGIADTPAVTYKSADTSVVTVDADGKITAKKTGKTTVTVTCAAIGKSALCAVEVVETKYSFDDNIMISIFWPPTPDYITDEQYKLIADAGVNWVLGAGEETLATVENQARMLELCAKYGIGMTVSDGHFGGSLLDKSEAEIAEAVSRYKNVPGAYGFYILDEPFNPNVYIDAYVALKKAAPNAYMHLNFLPSGAYGSTEIYKAQMDDWCRLAAAAGYPQDYLMFDRYPFPLQAGTMDRAGFFQNTRACYEVGLKNDVKTGMYIQTVSQTAAFRRPTDAEIRYEMYAALAFGYKQLSFFTWFTPVNRSEPFADGIISANGTPNAHYETVKTINHEILAIGETLVKCDALEVWFNGPDTYGQPSVPADFFVQAGKNDSVILSFLRHKETGRNYLMVVNNNYSAAQEIDLTFDKAITSLSEVSRADGTLKALSLNGQKLTITLAAGDAMLIALPEGFDHYEAPEGQPAATVNLAADAIVTCPTSPGTDGWYMSCLNDGQRISEGKGNGWRTDDTKPSYIDIDLGRVLDFNRLDIYPAGNIFDYGSSFPSDIKISVSKDGKTFTEVKSLSDLSVDELAGMTVALGAQTARYVRIDIVSTPKRARYAAFNEIEIYNDDGTVPAPATFGILDDEDVVVTYKEGDNIALGKNTFYSSTTPDHYKVWNWDITFINDGKKDNGWTSNVGLNPGPDATEYVGIKLGDLFAVDKIVLVDNGFFPEAYTVSVSADGRSWVNVHSDSRAKDHEAGTEIEILLDEAVPARFVRVTGTKLRGGGNDGYLLQLGEIEVYGTPICDKTVLQNAIDTFKAEGGDEGAKEYAAAVSAMDNALLTQTQAKDFAKKLLALVGKDLETDPAETEPATEPVTEPASEPGDVTEPSDTPAPDATTAPDEPSETTPADAGCASTVSLSALLIAGLSSLLLRKRREE